MSTLLVIDGNSILNRAFYGIMGNKMLMLPDGTYTNAVYGFLSILFKTIDEVKPEYMAIAFDLKAPTKRHLMYSEYKGTRKGMPDELAMQMPLLKEVLGYMNITIIEKEGYEADDILGTLSVIGSNNKLKTIILSGDRDTFQLVTKNVNVMIPHSKAGQTETDIYDIEKIKEKYGLTPKDLIEVKGLMGDTSDNIPGVPGIGEKTALKLIKEYKTIDNIYKAIENNESTLKGSTLDKIVQNKDKAILSRTLGTIDVQAPLEINISDLKIKEWDKEKVLEFFRRLRFNRYIDRFNLLDDENGEVSLDNKNKKEEKKIQDELVLLDNSSRIKEILDELEKTKEMYYLLDLEDYDDKTLRYSKYIKAISILSIKNQKVYYILVNNNLAFLKNIFENPSIKKIGYDVKRDLILLKQMDIEAQNMYFDIKIAAYLLNSASNQYSIENLCFDYLEENIDNLNNEKHEENQISLFEEKKLELNKSLAIKTSMLSSLKEKLEEKLKETKSDKLFYEIEMPLFYVLSSMEYEGIYVDKAELLEFGKNIKKEIEEKTNEIYHLAGDITFNINSPKQLRRSTF